MMAEERILSKFSRPRRERPAPGAGSSLVTKIGAPLSRNTPRQYPLWGGGGDRKCRVVQGKRVMEPLASGS
jgi:hypothetical protein